MRKVWQSLNESGIPFLSVHDEIICKQQNRHQAESLFRRVLDDEFTFYKLNVKRSHTSHRNPFAVQYTTAMPQATGDAEIWQVIEKQFTDRLNPDAFMQPGKSSDEIHSDLKALAADCLINYGLEVTPDQYYNALKWKRGTN